LAIPLVRYECPFESAEVTIYFQERPNVQGANIAYQPAQSVAVSRGRREVTFEAHGRGGTTNWLIIRLRSTAEECEQAPTDWPLDDYVPGERIVGECVVWRIMEYHKVWQSGE